MSKKNAIFLTLSQIGLGSLLGLVCGWVSLFIFSNLIGQGLIGNSAQHGFWIGLFLLISFGVVYGSAVVGVGEGVRFAGLRFNVDIDRKNAYRGAFLGAPAIVAVISLLNIHWEAIVAPNTLIYLILPVVHLIAYIISLPIHILIDTRLNFPPELLYIVSAPIGAILGYRIDWSHSHGTPPII